MALHFEIDRNIPNRISFVLETQSEIKLRISFFTVFIDLINGCFVTLSLFANKIAEDMDSERTLIKYLELRSNTYDLPCNFVQRGWGLIPEMIQVCN